MKKLNKAVIFTSNSLNHDLASKSVHGGAVSIASQGVQFILNLVGLSVLAHLLTPNDFGVLEMVAVVVGFAQMFKDAGLSMATVQKERISHEQISTLFWLNVLISGVLSLGVLVCAPWVARFYECSELTGVTAVLSLSLVISGLMIQHQALLRRCMWFGTLATITIASQIVTLGITILLAYCGWRYWALVGGKIVQALAGTLLTFYFCPWLPSGPHKQTGVRNMLKFGGHLTGFNFVNYFSRNADNLLIGKFIGANALGLYAKAYQLFLVPLTQIRQPIANVAMPVLSSLKHQPDRYVKYYQGIFDILVSLMIPVTLYCLIEADFLIKTILGPQWMAAVPVFRILAIAGLMQATQGLAGLVMLSLGRADRYFFWGTICAGLFIGSFVVGLPFGISGVATSYTIMNSLLLFPTLYYCYHKSPITVAMTMKILTWPFLISVLATGCLLLARDVISENSFRVHLALWIFYTGVVGGALYARKSFREVIALLLRGTTRRTVPA